MDSLSVWSLQGGYDFGGGSDPHYHRSVCVIQKSGVGGIFGGRVDCLGTASVHNLIDRVWPYHKSLIGRGNKDDRRDAVDLCRLLKLGELVDVFHPSRAFRVQSQLGLIKNDVFSVTI